MVALQTFHAGTLLHRTLHIHSSQILLAKNSMPCTHLDVHETSLRLSAELLQDSVRMEAATAGGACSVVASLSKPGRLKPRKLKPIRAVSALGAPFERYPAGKGKHV